MHRRYGHDSFTFTGTDGKELYDAYPHPSASASGGQMHHSTQSGYDQNSFMPTDVVESPESRAKADRLLEEWVNIDMLDRTLPSWSIFWQGIDQ